jgi:magnesium transporter
VRLLSYQNGRWVAEDNPSPDAARKIALGPTPVWVRAEGSNAEDWDQLDDWFDLHPLALEDIANSRQRPKVEDYPGVTFAAFRVPRFINGDLEWTQVGIFLGEGFVLTATVHTDLEPAGVPELDHVERRLLAGAWKEDAGTVDRIFYRLADAIVDTYFPFMDQIEDDLDIVEEEVVDKADRSTLDKIRNTKHLLSRLRKVISPMREAALSLERSNHPNIRPETQIYLRDVSDHMVRIHERLEHVKEVVLIAQESWNSTLANQQNQVMKRLTVIAALLLVPGLFAGLGGMNFEGIPDWNYWAVTASILGFVVVGVTVAIRRKWL